MAPKKDDRLILAPLLFNIALFKFLKIKNAQNIISDCALIEIEKKEVKIT